MTDTVEAYRDLLAKAPTLLDRMQIMVAANREYFSYKCWEYERAQFCWKWREQY